MAYGRAPVSKQRHEDHRADQQRHPAQGQVAEPVQAARTEKTGSATDTPGERISPYCERQPARRSLTAHEGLECVEEKGHEEEQQHLGTPICVAKAVDNRQTIPITVLPAVLVSRKPRALRRVSHKTHQAGLSPCKPVDQCRRPRRHCTPLNPRSPRAVKHRKHHEEHSPIHQRRAYLNEHKASSATRSDSARGRKG